MKKNTIFKIFKLFLPLVSRYKLFYVFIFSNILIGLSSGLITYFMQKFLDSIESAIAHAEMMSTIYLSLFFLAFFVIGHHVINGIGNFYSDAFGEVIHRELQKKLLQKISTIDPIRFEDKDFLDTVDKAKNGSTSAFYVFCVFMILFVLYLPYCLFMGVYMYRMEPVLALSLVFVFIPTMLSQIIKVGIFSKLENKTAPIRRTVQHYNDSICGKDYFKETRMLGIFEFIKAKLAQELKRLQQVTWDAEKKSRHLEVLTKTLTLIGYGGVLALLVYSTINRNISIGAFVAIFASIGTMFDTLNEAICIHINNASNRLGAVRNFIDFLDYPQPQREKHQIDHTGEFMIDNVTFQYPSSNYKALDSVSFRISPGETIAIVGENGSGKTTLARIITGIFDPTEGHVFLDGVDLSLTQKECVYDGISAVFQKFQKYKQTLQDNVYISHTRAPLETEAIEISLHKSGLESKDQSFDQGLNTMLSREFDGVDLSGGQWQRVAIARGYHREHNIILLDEPTASIDPIEETDVYRKFSKLSKDKTAIVITHRLGLTKLVDRILVLDQGQLIEEGSHEELINFDGKYAQMYHSQLQWYQDEEECSK